MKQTGVLIDVISIQKYLFNSNKLKHNIGSSYNISTLYNFPDDYVKEYEFKMVFEGGGNCFLTFKNKDNAQNFIKNFSLECLLKGISIITSFTEVLENEDLKNTYDKLSKLLRKRKSEYISDVIPANHGISSICKDTGLPADNYINDYLDNNQIKYVSNTLKEKLESVNRANKNNNDMFKNVLSDNYQFPDELEDMAQDKDENNFISVVHIDGNNMGKRFSECINIEEMKLLSQTVKEAVKKSFTSILNDFISERSMITPEIKLHTDENMEFLPIRPIILGGDDITFVSNGLLGIYFAEKFIKYFMSEKDHKGNNFSACAGVMTVKTKYPFYRAYIMAEELCANAKKHCNKGANESKIDFHMSYSGISGTIDNIRQNYYKSNSGELCLRPYLINNEKADLYKQNIDIEDFSKFESLKEIVRYFRAKRSKKDWSISRLKELREVLYFEKNKSDEYIRDAKSRDYRLPIQENSAWFSDSKNMYTPYFDAIELIEFYPEIKGK